jgi:hypothetical protein
VDVQIDRGPVQIYRCEDGQVQPGALVSNLFPGRHDIRLSALSPSDGCGYYSTVGTLDTLATTTVSASYSLQWAVGGVAVRWEFAPGQSCSNTGGTVNVNFTDATGVSLYAGDGDPQVCDAGTSNSIPYNCLPPATYTVRGRANGTGRSYSAMVRGITINAGQFANPDQPVILTLQ